jgi:hypothetical protein
MTEIRKPLTEEQLVSIISFHQEQISIAARAMAWAVKQRDIFTVELEALRRTEP